MFVHGLLLSLHMWRNHWTHFKWIANRWSRVQSVGRRNGFVEWYVYRLGLFYLRNCSQNAKSNQVQVIIQPELAILSKGHSCFRFGFCICIHISHSLSTHQDHMLCICLNALIEAHRKLISFILYLFNCAPHTYVRACWQKRVST